MPQDKTWEEIDFGAHASVQLTLHRYNIAGDVGNAEALAATFTPDGTMESPFGCFTGRAAIIAELDRLRAALQGKVTRVRHHLTTQLATFEGPARAHSRAYFFVITDKGPDHSGTYTDTLVPHGSEWLLEARKVRIDWIASASPFRL